MSSSGCGKPGHVTSVYRRGQTWFVEQSNGLKHSFTGGDARGRALQCASDLNGEHVTTVEELVALAKSALKAQKPRSDGGKP